MATLEIATRENKKPKALRAEGKIPATIYGAGLESKNVQVNSKEFSGIKFADYKKLVELNNAGEKVNALIKNIDKDYITGEVKNIEFYQTQAGLKMNAVVAITYTGASEAIKLGASLVEINRQARVKCAPENLPASLEVNLDALASVGDFITFADKASLLSTEFLVTSFITLFAISSLALSTTFAIN